MKRKGISPILASVLLLAVSLAVAGVFSGWAPNLAQQVTDSTENQTEHRIECDRSSVELVSAHHDGTDLSVTVRNSGQTDLPGIIVAAFDSDGSLLDQESISLDSGQLDDTDVTGISEPAYVEAYSETCGSVTDTLEQVS